MSGNNGENKIQVYSEIINRAALASLLGKQFGGARDLYDILGYDKELTYDSFVTQYGRHDMAAAIIDRPVDATWRGPLELLEADDDKETELEKKWKELEERLSLKSRFVRLDKLTSLGHYGVLLLGLGDVQTREQYALPVAKNAELLYVKPFGEGAAKIKAYEDDPKSERFGMPKAYTISIKNKADGKTIELTVHHTRVIHVAVDLLESETEGTPALKKVFNRLKDLEKLVGGSAEMFWRGARPGYQGKLDKDFSMDKTGEDDLKAQVDEYEHGLRRILVNEGLELKGLDSQISDPLNHVDVQVQMISAATGIPKRILVGSERGELASSQDKESWLELITDRRTEYAEPVIVRAFVKKCMELGVLPKVETYSVNWKDLFAVSEKDQAEVGKTRAQALKEYMQNPMAESVVPPAAFFEYFLGLTSDQIQVIQEMISAAAAQEQRSIAEETDDELNDM